MFEVTWRPRGSGGGFWGRHHRQGGDQHQQRGKIKGKKVVGLNDLESLRAVFRVFNILGGDEEGGEEGGGDRIYVCSLDLSYLLGIHKSTAKMI